MDFVADQLADGHKIRTLTIVDLFTRECLGIEVGFSLRADHVVAAMNRLKYDRGLPERITTDNGSEFAGSQMISGRWNIIGASCWRHGATVRWVSIRQRLRVRQFLLSRSRDFSNLQGDFRLAAP